ncbi:Kidins220, partial [Symbiodinium pilosum]
VPSGSQSSQAQITSPADLFRLMESAVQSEAPAGCYPSAGGALERAGVSDTVREHALSHPRPDAQGDPPKRVSKFKADRA